MCVKSRGGVHSLDGVHIVRRLGLDTKFCDVPDPDQIRIILPDTGPDPGRVRILNVSCIM